MLYTEAYGTQQESMTNEVTQAHLDTAIPVIFLLCFCVLGHDSTNAAGYKLNMQLLSESLDDYNAYTREVIRLEILISGEWSHEAHPHAS